MNEELKMRLCYYSGIKTGMDGLLKAIENVEESGHELTNTHGQAHGVV